MILEAVVAFLFISLIQLATYGYGFINAHASIKHIHRLTAWQKIVFCHRIGDRGWK